MRIKDIMSLDLWVIEPNEPISSAVWKMETGGIGCLVVCENEKAIGILTDRDLALGCLSSDHDHPDCRVCYHMTSPAIIGTPDMELVEAARLMVDKDIKRLPVVENGKLVGLVSFSDISLAMIPPMLHLMVGMSNSRRARRAIPV